MNAEHLNSGNVELYTPAHVIEAAREAMGGIDLDPASNAVANEIVAAARFYTREEDGLAQPWFGRVWMNHPFEKGRNHLWVNKLVESYVLREIEAACCITWANMPEAWMRPLLAYPQCFPHGRIHYRGADGVVQKGAPKGSVITYLGPDVARFKAAFAHIGTVKVAL